MVDANTFVSNAPIRIEVVYALPTQRRHIELTLANGATVGDAMAVVAAAPEFAGLAVHDMPVGIFGRMITDRSQRLNEGDRIELYRPLAVDPKTARRRRAGRDTE